jgi:hypothetical protein
MPSVGFEPAIPVSERPQTHALDRAATGIGTIGPYSILQQKAGSLPSNDVPVTGNLPRNDVPVTGKKLLTLV